MGITCKWGERRREYEESRIDEQDEEDDEDEQDEQDEQGVRLAYTTNVALQIKLNRIIFLPCVHGLTVYN